MTRHIFAACGALAIAGLTLSAQTPQSSPTQPPGTRTPNENGRTTTMTGCLKPWDGSMGAGAVGSGTTASGATKPGTQFVLTNISEGAHNPGMTAKPGTPTGSTPGSGTTTAPTPDMGHGSVVVKASDASVNLQQHLNHKVELTGMLASDMGATPPRAGSMPGAKPGSTPETKPGSTPATPGTSTPGSPTTGSPSTMGKPSADHMKMPTFSVTALKMVSATCD